MVIIMLPDAIPLVMYCSSKWEDEPLFIYLFSSAYNLFIQNFDGARARYDGDDFRRRRGLCNHPPYAKTPCHLPPQNPRKFRLWNVERYNATGCLGNFLQFGQSQTFPALVA